MHLCLMETIKSKSFLYYINKRIMLYVYMYMYAYSMYMYAYSIYYMLNIVMANLLVIKQTFLM